MALPTNKLVRRFQTLLERAQACFCSDVRMCLATCIPDAQTIAIIRADFFSAVSHLMLEPLDGERLGWADVAATIR